MISPTTIAIAILAGLLAISAAGNIWMHDLWVGAKTELATTEERRAQALGAALECSRSIADLEEEAAKRAAAALPALAAAQARALSAPVPGDDCGSARARFGDWLKGRAPP